MDRFHALFGIEEKSVRKNCLLLPFLPPGVLDVFGVKEMARGAVFASANAGDITLIRTGMSAGFVGDAALYLEDSPCANIFFLGSCGLVNQETGLGIGSLVLPCSAYGIESFSDIATNRIQVQAPLQPDPGLVDAFMKTAGPSIRLCGCVSFASLHEEEKFIPLFNELKADVIEMECAALFCACKKINRKALALLYVSDILGRTRFFETLSPKITPFGPAMASWPQGLFGQDGAWPNKKDLAAGAGQAATLIRDFVRP